MHLTLNISFAYEEEIQRSNVELVVLLDAIEAFCVANIPTGNVSLGIACHKEIVPSRLGKCNKTIRGSS